MKIKLLQLVALILLLGSVSVQAKEYSLVLEQALITSNGRVPVLLSLQHNGSSFVSGKAIAPYYMISALSYSIGNFRSFNINVSGLTLSGNTIQGSFSTSITNTNGTSPITVSCNINCIDNNGVIKGEYSGTSGTTPTIGGIEGSSFDKINPAGTFSATLFLEYPYPTAFTKSESTHSMHISFDVTSGTITNSWAQHAQTKSSCYGSTITPTNFTEVVQFISANGDRSKALRLTDYMLTVVSQTATITADTLYGDVEIQVKNGTTTVGTFIYKLKCKVVGTSLIGTYDVYNGATSIKSNGFCLGHIGSANTVTMPTFDAVTAVNYQAGTAFTPPYFDDLTQQQWQNKLEAAGIWLYNAPEIGFFHSDVMLTNISGTGDKQYDNKCLIGYGGTVSMLTLARVTKDKELARKALISAQRGGYYLQSQGWGKYQLREYYKKMIWQSVFSGRAYMELYKETGDREWLDLAKKYAAGLKDLQLQMKFTCNGTWTFYNEELDAIGESDDRYNRAWDNKPLHCGDYLYFLGSLRVDGGVNDYVQVENDAYDWMKNNMDRYDLWYRRTNWVNDTEIEVFGPSTYLLYLLNYASTVNDAHLNQLIQYVETNFTNWAHASGSFTPSVTGYFPRFDIYDSPRASVSASSRMAWVYLLMYKKTGTQVYLDKGKALVYSALSRQNMTTGMLHHLGQNALSADDITRILAYDQHQYTALKAESIHNLYNCYKILLELDEIEGENVLAIIQADKDSASVPATINFSGSTSKGNAKTYAWDFGDGTTATGVSPSHSYTKAGTYQVSLMVTSNGITDKTSIVVKIYNAPVLTYIKVDTTAVMILTNGTKQFTARALDQYERLLSPQPAITWTVSGSNTVNASGLVTAQSTAGGHVPFTVTATSGSVSGTAKFYVVNQYPALGYRYLKVIVDKGALNSHVWDVIWYDNGVKWPPVYFSSNANGDMTITQWGEWTSPYKIYDNLPSSGGECRAAWNTNTLDLSSVYTIRPDSVFINCSNLDPGRLPDAVYFAASQDNINFDTLYKQAWPSGVTKQTIVFSSNKLGQYISFEAIPDKKIGDAPFTINAASTSGLPVSFNSSNPAVANVSGNLVTITGVGTVTITASQTGNGDYLPAANVERTFLVDNITKVSQIKGNSKLCVYPNPTTGLLTITGINETAFVFNSMGTMMMVIEKDKNNIDVSNFPTGIYFIKTSYAAVKIVKK